MKKSIKGIRTDLASEKNKKVAKHLYFVDNKNIKVSQIKDKNKISTFISFKNLEKVNILKNVIKKELRDILKGIKLEHVFVIGLGNDLYTADSLGPEVLKYIQVNAFLPKLEVNITSPKISALEPGVLGKTGIETKKIIESVVEKIKPNLVIIVDSYVTKNIKNLNATIEITNEGITPGSGLRAIDSEISFRSLGVPVIVIGVPTAIEMICENKNLLVATSDVDDYILKVARIIGTSINEVLYNIE